MARPLGVGLLPPPSPGTAVRSRHDPRLPGETLVHPAILGAIALLLLNDHVLKASLPGLLTGKLSDFAGLAFFPILLLSTWELALGRFARWRGPDERVLAVAIAMTAIAFALVKTLEPAGAAFGWILGVAQWLFALPIRLIEGATLPAVAPGVVMADATDLVALIALVVPWWVGRRRSRDAQSVGAVVPVPAPQP